MSRTCTHARYLLIKQAKEKQAIDGVMVSHIYLIEINGHSAVAHLRGLMVGVPDR